MITSLHIANILATENVCYSGNAQLDGLRHNRKMSELWPNYISYWRKRAKLSQDDLAAALAPPTTKGTISQYESGKRKPSQGRLSGIANVLGCSPGELLDGPTTEAVPQRPQPWVPSAETLELLIAAGLGYVSSSPLPQDDLEGAVRVVLSGLRLVAQNPEFEHDPMAMKAIIAAVSAQQVPEIRDKVERA